MTRVAKMLLVLVLPLAVLAGCDSRTAKTDGGGVLLSITDLDGFPILVSVNSLGPGELLFVETITVSNNPKNPNAPTSSLMDVELTSVEITFTRADNGTRVPPPLVLGAVGYVPVNGTSTRNNLVLMDRDQFDNRPLSDLLFENGGVDGETGLDRMKINVFVRFFGRTVSGDEVESNTNSWTIEFTP